MDSFERQLLEQTSRLRRYATVLTRGRGFDAADLVQDTLVRAIEKRNLYEDGSDLRAWLFTIMHNTLVNDARRRARRGEEVLVEDVTLSVEADAITSITVNRDLRKALRRLSVSQRRIVLMVADGFSYEEVARAELLPIGTVRSQLSRARQRLAMLLHGAELEAEELEEVGCGR